MQHNHITKYKPYPLVDLPDRTWPNNKTTKAPIWCSVDLRDGNQALINPMDLEQKLEFFNELVRVGFKEIEIGFPSASETEFEFCRKLIEDDLIPDDVTIQVLVQCREALIKRTFEAIEGAKNVIVHFYNSTNPLQRRVTFGKTKEEIKQIAVDGARWSMKAKADLDPKTQVRFEYSPESFSDTELDYAIEICEAVMDEIKPTPEWPLILNLPATMELFTPNVHADQIEYFCRKIKNRDSVIISLHTHNDRGTSVAASELGLLAGADRVEGTLFGNGERTGNCDVMVMALNLYAQGVDPELDFTDMARTREIYESCTELTVHDRHPYAGDLVFTAFSGSHQDAVKKGFEAAAKEPKDDLWAIPYLTIDPADLGRAYEALIRINGQSGKGGIAYVLKKECGIDIPKAMQSQVYQVVQDECDITNKEILPQRVYEIFKNHFLSMHHIQLEDFKVDSRKETSDKEKFHCHVKLVMNGELYHLQGYGNGPIDALVDAIREAEIARFELLDYKSEALSEGSDADAVTFVPIKSKQGEIFWGVGIDSATDVSSLKAVLMAVDQLLRTNK